MSEVIREKITDHGISSEVEFKENKILSFNRSDKKEISFRVYKDGYAGIQYKDCTISDEEGYALAEKNLELKRPYPYQPETGVRHRDKAEKCYTDKEVMGIARELLGHIVTNYPDFTFGGSFSQYDDTTSMENSLGMDYSNRDCSTSVNLSYKHKDSKDLDDGYISFSLRTYDKEKAYEIIDNNLANFTKVLEIPDELILQNQYYGLLGKLRAELDAESMSLGTSLLSGKIGQKLFSENFTLEHNVSDEITWNNTFFDGEGVVLPDDKMMYIENGVLLRGYADKHIAEKYGVQATGSAGFHFADIPRNGRVNLQIKRSTKTIKELLDGRLTFIPVQASGGGFNEKGDYVTPVQKAFLTDGEKILGRLPEFTISVNLFDMFGDNFIGVGSDQPIFNDKSILIKVNRVK